MVRLARPASLRIVRRLGPSPRGEGLISRGQRGPDPGGDA